MSLLALFAPNLAVTLPEMLHHVSENRLFYATGLLLFSLLILLSTSNTPVRRVFGTFAIIGIIALGYYFFIGIRMPSMREVDWRGPIGRSYGLRLIRLWERVPPGSTLFDIREKNFMGPWNTQSVEAYLSEIIREQTGVTAGPDAPIEYRPGFRSKRIFWREARVQSVSGPVYVWVAEFKQQRVAVVLKIGGRASQYESDLQDAETFVRKIR